jgi:tRNA(Ile)-lysidine synthase
MQNNKTGAADIEKAVWDALSDIKSGAVIIAAVSGGADSMALLAALAALKTGAPWQVQAVHIQHNLRGEESAGDEKAVLEFCKQAGIPCLVQTVPRGEITRDAKKKGVGIEAAARTVRHKLLREAAARYEAARILVAHTHDDLLENIIIRILRGAGPQGLAVMPARRGKLQRPLLSVTRSDITHYLAKKNIEYRTDSSNFDAAPLRNRVRLYIIPVLRAHFSGWEANLEAMAKTQSILSAYLKKKALRAAVEKSDGKITVRNFFSYPEILREEILFSAYDSAAKTFRRKSLLADEPAQRKRPPRRAVIRKFASGGAASVDTGSAVVRAAGNDAIVSEKKPGGAESGFSVLIKNEGTYKIGDMTLECRRENKESFVFVLRKNTRV